MIREAMAYLQVRVTPGAREAAIGEWREGILHVKVREPADKGKANEAVIKLVAKRLGVPARAVTLKSGGAARTKLLSVEGLSDSDLQQNLSVASP
jgi:uncharacterized protein (TIGR00251 family)